MIWPQRPASAPVTAPVSENRHEVAPGATDNANGPQIGSETSEPLPITSGGYEPTIAPCGCGDEETDRLRDMVRGGMGQMEASRAIWGTT